MALGKIVRSQQLTTNRIKFLLDLIDGNFMIRKKISLRKIHGNCIEENCNENTQSSNGKRHDLLL